MSDNNKFTDSVKGMAEQVMDVITASGETTSWDIKLKLHLSSSSLYLALGWLMSQGRIQLYPKDLNYTIRPAAGQQ